MSKTDDRDSGVHGQSSSGYDTHRPVGKPPSSREHRRLQSISSIGSMINKIVPADVEQPATVSNTQSGNLFHRLVVGNPVPAFGIALSGQILGILVSAILIGTDSNGIFPYDNGARWKYDVKGSEISMRNDAWFAMTSDVSNNYWERNLPIQQSQSYEFTSEGLEVIYKGSCFDKTNLASMRVFENALMNLSGYEKICRWDYGANACSKPKSILRFFDASYLQYFSNLTQSNTKSELLFANDPNFERISGITQTIYHADGDSDQAYIQNAGNPDIRKILNFHIGRPNIDYDANNPESASICRSLIYAGYPLKGFLNIHDRLREQQDQMEALHVATFKSFLESNGRVGNMKMIFSSRGLRNDFYDVSLAQSYQFVIGSVVVALVGLLFMTHSILLTLLMSIGMVGSFFWTNLIYRYVFGVQNFGLSQQLAVYIMFFMASVHALTLFGAWVRASDRPDVETRLTVAWRETNVPMLTTTVATSLAFFAFCFSSITAVVPFALLCGIFSWVNYLTWGLYLPTVLVVRHHFGVDGAGHAQHVRVAKWEWITVSGHTWTRWIVLSFSCMAVAALTIIVVNKFTNERMQNVMYSRSNNYGHYDEYSKTNFGGVDSEHNTKVLLVWGLDKLLDNGCADGSAQCKQTPTYNEAFDLSSPTAQVQLLQFCNQLKNLDISTVNRLMIRRQSTGQTVDGVYPLELKCFIAEQDTYLRTSGVAEPIPYNFTSMQMTMQGNNESYPSNVYTSASFNYPFANSATQTSCTYCDSYYRHYEIGVLDFITNGGQTAPGSDNTQSYIGLVGGVADPSLQLDSAGYMTYAGNYGSVLRYAAIEVNLTLNSENLDYDVGIAIMNEWDKFLQDATKTLSIPLQNAYQTCNEDRTWSWMQIQKNLRPTLVQGYLVGGALGVVTVLVFANNVSVAVLSLVTLACIVIAVMGVYACADWKYAIGEVINLSMVGGVACEMVVPIAMFYARSPAVERTRKAHDALAGAWLGVVGGAFFSGVGGLFLLASPLWYFLTFGATFVACMGLGLVICLCVFVVVLGITGPERAEGKIFGRHGMKPQFVPSRAHSVGFAESFSAQGVPMNTMQIQQEFYSDANPLHDSTWTRSQATAESGV